VEFALQPRKKHGKTLVMVAAGTSQADRVNFKKMNSTIHRRKTGTQGSTMS
jgi:hypothetical protein